MNFQELLSKMAQLDQPVQEEKKADKDYDGDGKVESGKDEYMGSRMKAAEKSKEEKVDEELVDECGMMPPMGPMDAPKQQDSVTMNVSMNGSGAGGIKDLMNILRNIEAGGSDEKFGEPDADILIKKMSAPGSMIDDDFANQPDEVYQDIRTSINPPGTADINGGDHRPRQAGLPSGKPTMESLTSRLEQLYQTVKNR